MDLLLLLPSGPRSPQAPCNVRPQARPDAVVLGRELERPARPGCRPRPSRLLAPVTDRRRAVDRTRDRQAFTPAFCVGGELWCWGNNNYNAIGVDTFANPLPLTRVLDNVAAVAAGAAHTCAIRGDQTLWCWGWNEDGQLGVDPGSLSRRRARSKAAACGGGSRPASFNTCGITIADELFCWGNNEHAQVVQPPTPKMMPYSAPEQIQPGVAWTDVSVGALHTCALRATASRRSGWNGFGQLGTAANGSTVTITTGEPGRTWIRVFSRFYQTCALRDDAQKCRGARRERAEGNSHSTMARRS